MPLVHNFAGQLGSLNLSREVLRQTAELLKNTPVLVSDLTNPTIPMEKKARVIQKVFPPEIRSFLKLLCEKDALPFYDEIVAVWESENKQEKNIVTATLTYVTAPNEKQLAGIRKFISTQYGASDSVLIMKEDPSIEGGFVLHVGDMEYDWSTKGRMEQLRRQLETAAKKPAADREGIVSILRSEIEGFKLDAQEQEIGTVTFVGDGVAIINGLDHAMYGEIVVFDGGLKGMVQDIRRSEICCILFGREDELHEGTRVMRTGKSAGVPTGNGMLGRVVDALGAPIDGEGPIDEEEYRSIEHPAPSIIDREEVCVPMETGILSIDSMFPIGRGQRELIIGDRQTGKTSLAVDTILNQKGKDVICVYVSIGQKSSSVAKTVGTLKRFGAMDYTIVVSATAADPSSLQYVAPYAGTAIAEFFLYRGRDVLIVYDDLSKHAVAYRALSLLLERSPGREAYPGDVFYLHSRLLERSCRLNKENGGGSLTALPIIETLAGDVSAYIPTNVISITDGQIFLESDLFFSGMRPAVNVGLSVSRVGGKAQTGAMKKASGTLRIDLAQYRELEIFTQYSSDLDDSTKEQLIHGKALIELLIQPLHRSLSMAEQVISLLCASNKLFLDLPPEKVKAFQTGLLEYMHQSHSDLIRSLEENKKLDSSITDEILAAAASYKKTAFSAAG